MSEQYGRLFEIYEYSHIPIKTFQCSEETDNPPIRLSYHNGNHYNSVRDPYRATIGEFLYLISFVLYTRFCAVGQFVKKSKITFSRIEQPIMNYRLTGRPRRR